MNMHAHMASPHTSFHTFIPTQFPPLQAFLLAGYGKNERISVSTRRGENPVLERHYMSSTVHLLL